MPRLRQGIFDDVMSYDSLTTELKSEFFNFRNLLPDVDISLCGGLESDNPNFSTVLFEQSKVTFDDFVLHLQVNFIWASKTDLVVF